MGQELKIRKLEPVVQQLAAAKLQLHELLLIEQRYELLKETLD
jgi:hypothetical protein